MAYSAAAAAMQLPAVGESWTCKLGAPPHVLSHKRFLSGRPLSAAIDFLPAAGYRLRWIVPGTASIRKSMPLLQVLKAELEESNIDKEELKEVKMRKVESEAKMRKEESEEENFRQEGLEESNMIKEESKESKVKKANLFVSRSVRMYLPTNTNSAGMPPPISSFFSRPSGAKSILNISALQDFQYLGPNTYRCTLPKMKFLNFEVTPVLDLRVTTTCEECIVEMLSCRIEGSKVLENQNKHFSASAKNHIAWNMECEEPFVDINMELNVILEVCTLPFSMLPVSAVERPGNVILQSLLNMLVPNFLEQLLEDYRHWLQTGEFESESEPLFLIKPNIELDEA